MGHLTPIIGLRLLALAAGLRHNAEIGQPGPCFSAYGHKFGINHLVVRTPCRERGKHLVLDRWDVAHQRPNPGRREHEDAALASRNARGVKASALGWASVREWPLEDMRPELAGADEFSVLCQSQPRTG